MALSSTIASLENTWGELDAAQTASVSGTGGNNRLISPDDTASCLLYRYVVDTVLNISMVVMGFIGK